jgi:4-hydroxy-2-oxoheptanedioate aldolase
VDYPQWISEQLFVAVQIESAQAVVNAEAILATPGVDGCWVGPSDLAFSLGFAPSEMDQRDEHTRALERVIQACRNTGKIPGIAGRSLQDGQKRAAQGFQFITASGDAGLLLAGATAGVKQLKG